MVASQTSKDNLVKGTAILNLKKYLESTQPGLFFELAQQVSMSRTGLILASSWYSANQAYDLQELAAEKMGMTSKDIAIAIARYSVEVDLNGVYRFFMKIGGPEVVFRNLPKLGKAYANYFQVYVEENQSGFLRARISSNSEFIERATWSTEGAIRGIMNNCNKTNSEFHISPIMDNGDNLLSMILEVGYS